MIWTNQKWCYKASSAQGVKQNRCRGFLYKCIHPFIHSYLFISISVIFITNVTWSSIMNRKSVTTCYWFQIIFILRTYLNSNWNQTLVVKFVLCRTQSNIRFVVCQNGLFCWNPVKITVMVLKINKIDKFVHLKTIKYKRNCIQ